MISGGESGDRERGIRPRQYRLPGQTRLGRVRLQVADLDRSLRFYERVLGLRVITRSAETVTLGPHDDDREIVELRRFAGARRVPERGLLGLYHFAILLPDRAALGRFIAQLAEIGERAGMSDHAVSEAVYLTDPDGLGIEVYADRPRDAWRYDERQIYMTTARLDAASVVARRKAKRGRGCLPARCSVTSIYMWTISMWPQRFTTTQSGSTRWCGAIPARSFSRREDITTTWARTPGRPGPLLLRTMMRGCSSGRSWSPRLRMRKGLRPAWKPPDTRFAATEKPGKPSIHGGQPSGSFPSLDRLAPRHDHVVALNRTLAAGNHQMKPIRSKNLFLALAFVGLAGCGDSSGPGTVSAEDALRSLSLGLGSAAGTALPFALSPSSLGTAARGIDKIDVAIDGTTQSMYALGLRVTYPAGTCVESLFITPSAPPSAGQCTPPPLGLVLVLWQTSSGSRPPDRMAFISAEVGTASFTGFFEGTAELTFLPAFAIFINDREEFWMSVGGSLSSRVAATNETCNVAPPPFAAVSTCHFATFDEAGQITFERFDFALIEANVPPARARMELAIPRQTIRGILQAITRITPVTIPGDWDY